MEIRRMEPSNVGAVAKLMSAIKPDWWDFEGANQQLQDVGLLAKLVGWYLEKDGAPKGWLLCAEYAGYACLTIENLGYDENGAFVMEQQLEPLLQRAEQYARQRGLRNMRYIIGSTGMSCHGRPITDFAEELRTLRSLGRAHFDYFRSIGFVGGCAGNPRGVVKTGGTKRPVLTLGEHRRHSGRKTRNAIGR